MEWIGEIPENWETRRLKNGLRKKKVIINKYDNQPILSLTMNGVSLRDLVNPKGKMPTTFDGYQEITPGNIIECLFDIDVTPRCVGIARDYGLTSPAYTQFEVINDFDTDFIYYYLLMLDNDKILVPISKSLRNTITSDEFLILPFSFPPVEEQRRISNRISTETARINSIISKTQQSIDELKKYKQALITETVTKGLNKNVEMKDSGIEWIKKVPKSWEIKKTRFFLKEVSEKNYPNEEILSLYRDYGVIPKNSRDDNHNVTSLDTSGYKLVNHNQLVINKMKAWQGSMAISEIRGIISPAYYVYEVLDKQIYIKFLHYALRNNAYLDEYRRISAGLRIGQWDLNKDLFKNVKIAFPSTMDEQRQIVDFLEEKIKWIDNIVIEKEHLLIQFEQLKQSLIYEYVTGKKEA
ncbi:MULTISPECIES: restriction endonuclease subunit S [Enterococcus]|uniref:restriction endonuclease subunit S n=1 Tax=Enterococcus TaxID=1350 RepID=UPI001F4DC2CD|nr:restriction endonuclease subunit S [Enterococcus faecium]MCH9273622.1 restriction endonuclease subunit S [Enterococcus lactis]MDB7584207.1 restriction endonuclease subunit S [Enterococcus faecium]MDB7586392.1 restriction endonuclease subunit S [Enterococcus faecium]MDB7589099.1 restriction endonuclease subunit S [Enterococcus faecium]MDB7598820.1 restriction endonuclease subunit S [Enterococcus faecium]